MHRLLCAACAFLIAASVGASSEPPLRLNDMQVIGSHNSYRRMGDPAAMNALEDARAGLSQGLAYDHPSLAAQLDLGVRQLELDIFADPDGRTFAADGAPGFKVMHLPGLDDRSHCPTLLACLAEIRAWSQAHPRHFPIIITVDAKDEPFRIPGVTTPVPFTQALLAALDAELFEGLGRSRVITPEEVRGRFATLREAVRADAWPMLEAARGRVMIIFDVRAPTADLYRRDHPSLTGRAMFSVYEPDQNEAATFVVQDPRGPEQARIAALVRQGFFVRTRSDANTREARRNDRSMLEAAAASGAQVISTDYYPGAPDPLNLSFEVTLPGAALARCNPVRRAPSCRLGKE